MPATRPSRSSSTWIDHGARPPSGVRLVLPEPRRAVRHDRDEPRALAADARPETPLDDVVVGLQPQVVRRHVPRRVLAQERGQRVHVVALERVDVAGEERLVVGVERFDRAVPVAVLVLGRVERGARPLERAVHRRDARVEQLGDLAGLPAEHLAQDQDRALLRRQALERRDERQADGLARDRDLGRIAAGREPRRNRGSARPRAPLRARARALPRRPTPDPCPSVGRAACGR